MCENKYYKLNFRLQSKVPNNLESFNRRMTLGYDWDQ